MNETSAATLPFHPGYIPLGIWMALAAIAIVWAQIDADDRGKGLSAVDFFKTLFATLVLPPFYIAYRLIKLKR